MRLQLKTGSSAGSGAYIISTGGVGSEALESYFGRENINDCGGFPMHERDPQKIKSGSVLYVFGNPYNKILSFYRRGFFQMPYTHLWHIGGDYSGMSMRDSWTIEEYLKNGIDFFGIEKHFRCWLDYRQRTYNIIFVRYRAIPQNIDKIKSFFGLKPSGEFVFTNRKSDWKTEPENIRSGLVNMFGEYNALIESLPDVFKMRGNKIEVL